MFAPPGVDSDSSGEEDNSPPPAPPKPPKPGLFKTLFGPSQKLKEQQAKDEIKNLTPVQAAEVDSPRPPTPPKKKKVRIRLEGEEDPDRIDLVESPPSPLSPAESIEEISTGAMSPMNPGKRPEDVAGEVLVLLQKILAESGSRPSTPPVQGGSKPTNQVEDAAIGAAGNALGLAPTPGADTQDSQAGKKPSKLAKWTKLAMQVANPSSSNENSPSSSGSAAPPYSSPTQPSFGYSTTPPLPHEPPRPQPSPQQYPSPHSGPAYHHPGASSQDASAYQHYPASSHGYNTQHNHPFQTMPGLPSGGYHSTTPPQHQASYAAQRPQHDSWQPPRPGGEAQEYYSGHVYPSQPYPHQLAPSSGSSSAPPNNQSFSPGSQFNPYTDYPSRWRPGELHWSPSADNARYEPTSRSDQVQQEPYDLSPPGLPVQAGQRDWSSRTTPYGPDYSSQPVPPPPPRSAPPCIQQYHGYPQKHAYYPPPMLPPWQAYYPWLHPPYSPHSPYTGTTPSSGTSSGDLSAFQSTSPRDPPPIRPAQNVDTSPRSRQSETAQSKDTTSPLRPSHKQHTRMPSDTSSTASSVSSTPSPASSPSSPSAPTPPSPASPLSPRILKSQPDGSFSPVEPYPSAQAMLSPLTRSRGPPPDYRSNDDATPPGSPHTPFTPRKVRKEDMSPEKLKEYEAVIRGREERRRREKEEEIRHKAAEGSLSLEEVGIAIGKAKEAREGPKSDGPHGQGADPPHDGKRMDTKQESDTKLPDDVPTLKKMRERVKLRVERGELSKDQARPMLEKLNKAMTAQNTASDKPQSAQAPAKGAGTITPTGRGFIEVEKQLEETKYRMKKIKTKVSEGKMSKEEGKEEMKRLLARQEKLKLELPGPSSPAETVKRDVSVPSSKERMRNEGGVVARERLLEEGEMEAKGKGKGKEVDVVRIPAESTDPKEPGASRSASAKEDKDVKPPAGGIARPAEATGPAKQQEAVLKLRMEKVRQKVKDGKMDKDQAKRELGRLEEKRLRVQKPTITVKTQTERPADEPPPLEFAPNTRTPTAVEVVTADKEAENESVSAKRNEALETTERAMGISGQIDELKGRMKRIQMKVAEGKMSKEEGQKEMKRLQDRREKMKASLADKEEGVAQGGDRKKETGGVEETKRMVPVVEEGSSSQSMGSKLDAETAHHQSKDDTERNHMPRANSRDENGPAPDASDGGVVKAKIEQLRERMKRIEARVATGKMDKSEAKAEMTRLAERKKSLQEKLKGAGLPTDKSAKSNSDGLSDKDRGMTDRADKADSMPDAKGGTTTHAKPVSRVEKPAVSLDSPTKVDEQIRHQADRSAENEAGQLGVGQKKLEEVRARMQRIKTKVAEGKLSKEEGKGEMIRLKAKEKEYEALASSSRGEEEDKARVKGSDMAGIEEQTVREKMALVQRRVKEGKMDQAEGDATLRRLSQKLKSVKGFSSDGKTASDQPVELPDSAAPSRKARVEDAPEEGETKSMSAKIEQELEKNKRKLVNLQKKVVVASEEERPGLEKMLKELEGERKRLKRELMALSKPTASKAASAGPTVDQGDIFASGPAEAKVDAEELSSEPLDQDILQEILAFDLPHTSTSLASTPLALSTHVSSKTEERRTESMPPQDVSSPVAPGSYPWAAQMDSRTNDSDRQQRIPELKDVGEKTGPDKPAVLPGSAHLAPHSVNGKSMGEKEKTARSSSTDVTPDMSRNADRAVRTAVPGSPTIPTKSRSRQIQPTTSPAQVALPSAPHSSTTWSSCLVSLAECINLSNHLLTQHAIKQASQGQEGEASVFEQLVPRLLTALLLQQDLRGVLQRVFGDESAGHLEAFMRHLNQIKGYLSTVDLSAVTQRGKNEKDGLHGVMAITDHLLRLVKHASPGMMSSLRRLVHQWREHGLTITNVVHTIHFVKNDLMISPKERQLDGAQAREDDGAHLIDQLLDLLDTSTDHQTSNHKHKPHRLSLHAPPRNTIKKPSAHPAESSPPAHDQDHPHGVRQRLNSMLHNLRSSPSPPTTAPLRISRQPNQPHHTDTNAAESGSSREKHGFPIISESLSPTSKTRVAHHLIRPPTLEHEEYHPPQRAHQLHLPAATAEFMDPSGAGLGRGTTPKVPARRRAHEHSSVDASVPALEDTDESRPRSGSVSRQVARPATPHSRTAQPTHQAHPRGHPRETVIVRPPGPAYAPGSAHHVHRPSVYSSDSAYSLNSYDTDGTVESDAEARELLVHADSGPGAVNQNQADDVSSASEPDPEQVKRAKEVLMMGRKR